ncbi:MAG: hypothetical protein KKH25_01640, partial [Candidatus Omnitrophica bacterium]|nr:hypothetical protein [Candidatus Omnitrophota bacterium]
HHHVPPVGRDLLIDAVERERLRGDFRGSLFFLSTSQLISLVSLGLGFWFYYRKLKQRFKP